MADIYEQYHIDLQIIDERNRSQPLWVDPDGEVSWEFAVGEAHKEDEARAAYDQLQQHNLDYIIGGREGGLSQIELGVTDEEMESAYRCAPPGASEAEVAVIAKAAMLRKEIGQRHANVAFVIGRESVYADTMIGGPKGYDAIAAREERFFMLTHYVDQRGPHDEIKLRPWSSADVLLGDLDNPYLRSCIDPWVREGLEIYRECDDLKADLPTLLGPGRYSHIKQLLHAVPAGTVEAWRSGYEKAVADKKSRQDARHILLGKAAALESKLRESTDAGETMDLEPPLINHLMGAERLLQMSHLLRLRVEWWDHISFTDLRSIWEAVVSEESDAATTQP